MDELTNLISNVGFPIAAFCAMFYMCNTTIKENTRAIVEGGNIVKELMESKKEEKDV